MAPRMNSTQAELLVLDLETSGVNPFRHQVLSVGMVPLNGNEQPKVVYVRPKEICWTEYAQEHFAKYAAEWEAKAVPPTQACVEIERYLVDRFPHTAVTPVGHNVGFDVAFLRQLAFDGSRDQLAGLSHRAIDTHTLLYLLFHGGLIPSSALTSDGAFRHFGITVPKPLRHTALGDVVATRDLVRALLKRFSFEDGIVTAHAQDVGETSL